MIVIHTKCWRVVGWTTCETLPFHFSCLLITSCSHDQTSQDLVIPFLLYCMQHNGGWGPRDEAMGWGETQLCAHQVLANKDVHGTKTILCKLKTNCIDISTYHYTTTVTVDNHTIVCTIGLHSYVYHMNQCNKSRALLHFCSHMGKIDVGIISVSFDIVIGKW